MRLLVKSARQVVQVCNNGQRMLTGDQMSELAVMSAQTDDGLALAVDSEGAIAAIGTTSEVLSQYPESCFEAVLDATGQVLVPGLVDAHTHPVWDGDRVNEFAMKLSGASYMSVHESGGGIHFTVERTRAASEDQLLEQLLARLHRMSLHGTTLVECKSGYGLDTETELKMLRVLERAKKVSPIEIHCTFCGAHAIQKGMTSEEATNYIINDTLPALKEKLQSGELKVESIDVFCEKGVFNVEETRRILSAGNQLGLLGNFHGEELNQLHSAEMGAQLGVTAISHLECVSEEGSVAMARAGTVAVILPTTAYILRLEAPPVRRMIKDGVAVALGTDFNPNAYCLSMPVVMHLACVMCHMSLPEALAAATINAAASLGRSHSHGSLEVGKQADLLLINAPSWEHLVYQFCETRSVISAAVKAGRIIISPSAAASTTTTY